MKKHIESQGWPPQCAQLPVPPSVSVPPPSETVIMIPCYGVNRGYDGEYYLRSALWARYSIYRWTDAIEQGVRVCLYMPSDLATASIDILQAAGVSGAEIYKFRRKEITETYRFSYAYKVFLLCEGFLKDYQRVCIWDADVFAIPSRSSGGVTPFYYESSLQPADRIYCNPAMSWSLSEHLLKLVGQFNTANAAKYLSQREKELSKKRLAFWEELSAPLNQWQFSDKLIGITGKVFWIFPRWDGYATLRKFLKKHVYWFRNAQDEVVLDWAQIHRLVVVEPIASYSPLWWRHRILIEERDEFLQQMLETTG